ncbi:MAG: LuxR C-terminal-related transcriptional regulator, partial [Terriglobales bacterium]
AQPDVRIIMITTHDRDQDVFAALGAGADGYALKTIGRAELAIALKAVAGGAIWLDRGIAGCVLRSITAATTATASSPQLPKVAERLSNPLSPRELEVLELLVEGLTNHEMAQRLHVSIDTVKSHMRHIMEKLMVSDRTQAAVKAIKSGLASP